MAKRSYSEQETAALLERAAELQALSARTSEKTGLTLDELEAIALEAGLNPEHLRQAAQEMETIGPALQSASTSTNATHIFVEQWVDGDLSPEAVEDVITELRHRFDSDLGAMMTYGQSSVEQYGRTVEWKHTSMSGIETRVQMRRRGERVHLRMGQRVGLAGNLTEGIFYGGILAALIGLVGAALADSGAMGIFVFLMAALVAIPGVTYLDSAWRKKKHRELQALGDRLAVMIAENQPADGVEHDALEGREVSEADIDLLGGSDLLPEDHGQPVRRRGHTR